MTWPPLPTCLVIRCDDCDTPSVTSWLHFLIFLFLLLISMILPSLKLVIASLFFSTFIYSYNHISVALSLSSFCSHHSSLLEARKVQHHCSHWPLRRRQNCPLLPSKLINSFHSHFPLLSLSPSTSRCSQWN